MPAVPEVDAWNVIIDNQELPQDQWLRIVTNRIINNGDAADTVVAEYAIVDETDGSVFRMLCSASLTLDVGQAAGLTYVGDENAASPICELVMVDPAAGLGPLMYKFQAGDPDPLVFAIRTYVDGTTPPPWPGQDGQQTQTARITVDVVDGAMFGLQTARQRVLAAGAGGGAAAAVLASLIGS